jgi:hypothetical protein
LLVKYWVYGIHDNTRSIFFVDTGLLDSDGITGNNVITVDNLEEGITWQYSTSGDTGFTNGTGNSFTLTDATYEANAIQVRQIDEVGNPSHRR